MLIMNEITALKAIANGYIDILGERYIILSNVKGSCDNCYFYENELICPTIAQHICCTDGHILKKISNEEEGNNT